MKLFLGFPLYHSVPSNFFITHLAMDKSNVVGHIIIDGVYLPVSMEMIVTQVLQVEGWDRLLIQEADTIPPIDGYERASTYEPEQAIVGSMFFSHTPPYPPNVFIQDSNLQYNRLTAETVKTWVDDPALYECHAVGFGFTSIARHVLEEWDPKIPMFQVDSQGPIGSHDIWFCDQARKQGFNVYVDTSVVCGHLTEVSIGLEHNQSASFMVKDSQKISFGENKQQNKQRVLNVGGGTKDIPIPDHYNGWEHVLLDIDEKPDVDIVMDIRDLINSPDNLISSFDSVYTSHMIEHLEMWDIPNMLQGFKRVLKPEGSLEIHCPNFEEVFSRIDAGAALDDVAYQSPMGPIRYKDIVFGYEKEIEESGNPYYCHKTAITPSYLENVLVEAGFKEIKIFTDSFELAAVAKA